MFQTFNRGDRTGLVTNMGLSVGLALLVNGLVFLFFPASATPTPKPGVFDPPGWPVGSVWVLYPFYTLGLRSVVLGLAGNIATFLLAAWVASRIRKSSAEFAFVCPVIAWVAFATVLTARMLPWHHGA